MRNNRLDQWLSNRLAAVLLVAACVALALAVFVIDLRFTAIERWLVDRQLDRVERVLKQEVDSVARAAADYAQWDDTLAFLDTADPAYIEANFPLSTGENLNLDWGVVATDSGEIRAAIDFDAEEDFVPLDDALVAETLARLPTSTVLPPGGREGRLALIGDRPVLIGRSVVSDSAQETQGAGSLWFGRVLDDEELARLSELTDVAFRIETVEPVAALPRSLDRVADLWTGRVQVADRLQVVISVPALLSRQWVETTWLIGVANGLVMLVCVLSMRGLLRRKVTGRLQTFAELARAPPTPGAGEPRRWPEEGGDEIAVLGTALNRFVADLAGQQQVLDRLAHEDSLTGLANRRRLLELLDAAVGQQHPVSSLICFHLTEFRLINNALGHAAGDAALISVAHRLRQIAVEATCIARLEGSEFGVLMPGMDASAALAWLDSVAREIAAPVELEHRRFAIDIVAGAADGLQIDTALQWLRAAAVAMQAGRRAGERMRRFDPALQAEAELRLYRAESLARALEQDALEVWFQPIVDVQQGRVFAIEALARWRLDGQWIPPDSFIAMAEELGLIGRLGRLVLRRSCAALKRLREAGSPDLVCSVNVSPLQLGDPSLVGDIRQLLSEHGLDARALAVEITESAFASGASSVRDTLDALRGLGLRMWLDDFGVGHASLSRLQDHPFEALKIDRSFLIGGPDPQRERLLRGIVGLAEELELRVVAEGVESEDAKHRMLALRCPVLQGYLFSRPLPEAEIGRWLAAWSGPLPTTGAGAVARIDRPRTAG